jgi:exonuclease SbcC
VYDDFTGKERPAASLSGGETFMAALSMALGLSDRVQSESGGIQLDTLFIDEGFATLDADALDNAMNCLARLQRNGRIIGIISHVRELLDLVDDKIIVRKTEGGSYVKVVSAKA